MLTRVCLPAAAGRTRHGRLRELRRRAGRAPAWSAYAASKFGLRALADSLRAEEQEHGVRVTTVFPGRTATPMQEKVHEQEGRSTTRRAGSSPDTVVDAILHVLDLPRDATVSDLTIRPR